MAQVFYDSCTDSSGVDLTAHSPDVGISWIELVNDTGTAVLEIASSGTSVWCVASVGDKQIVMKANATMSSPDQDIELTVPSVVTTGTVDFVWISGRMTDENNMYAGGFYNTNETADKKLYKKVGGTVTELGSTDTGMSNGDRVKLELRTNSQKFYHDTGGGYGTAILTATDTAITATGFGGLGMGNTFVSTDDTRNVWRIDDFTVTEFITAVDELIQSRREIGVP